MKHALARKEDLMRRIHHTLMVAGVAICALTPAAHAAQAVPVSCGEVVTQDTRVANDLVDCPGDGLVIGAPGITLDLGGHTIDGDAVMAPDGEADVGVDNTAGHDGVTIRNGVIREFDVGVSLPELSRNRLSGLRVVRNAILGMDLDLADHSVVEDSTFSRNGADFGGPGIFVIGSQNVRIEDNVASHNGGAGILLLDSSGSDLRGNWMVANGDEGLVAADGSDDNSVTGNHAALNAFAGISIEGDRNAVSRNRASANEDGIVVVGSGNAITRNVVIGAVGCADGCGFGISLEGGTDNLIGDNTVWAAREAGIRLASFPPDTPETSHNAVLRNLVLNAGVDGLLVESTATDTLLEGNRARRAGDDGIDVDSAATTLTRNTAQRNGDLGIEAVAGVTDGGGNRASGNGNPAQCTGVDCARRGKVW